MYLWPLRAYIQSSLPSGRLGCAIALTAATLSTLPPQGHDAACEPADALGDLHGHVGARLDEGSVGRHFRLVASAPYVVALTCSQHKRLLQVHNRGKLIAAMQYAHGRAEGVVPVHHMSEEAAPRLGCCPSCRRFANAGRDFMAPGWENARFRITRR